MNLSEYRPFVEGHRRSDSSITALLVRGDQEDWTAESYRRLADLSDHYGDGLAALYWLNVARRCKP